VDDPAVAEALIATVALLAVDDPLTAAGEAAAALLTEVVAADWGAGVGGLATALAPPQAAKRTAPPPAAPNTAIPCNTRRLEHLVMVASPSL